MSNQEPTVDSAQRGDKIIAPKSSRMRRHAVSLLVLFATSLSLTAAIADEYPSRPIKLIVGLSAGGASDALARIIGKELGARLKQPVVIENKPGAGGNVASEFVAKAPADGYTLLFTADNHNLNPLVYQNSGYTPQKDFTGVILVSEYGLILCANSSSRYKTIPDLVEIAKKEPGAIFYGSSGIGLPNHIAMEKFNKTAGVQITHVAYKGSSLSISDAVSGQIPLVMSTIAAAQPFITSNKLIPLAVTGSSRWPTLPQVPTMAESGFPAATSLSWMGIVAPSATPQAITSRLNHEIQAILEQKSTQDQFLKLGMGVGGGSREKFNEYLAQDMNAAKKIVSDINLKIE